MAIAFFYYLSCIEIFLCVHVVNNLTKLYLHVNFFVETFLFQNAHVLQAVLILIRELDKDSLEIVNSATQKMLHSDP